MNQLIDEITPYIPRELKELSRSIGALVSSSLQKPPRDVAHIRTANIGHNVGDIGPAVFTMTTRLSRTETRLLLCTSVLCFAIVFQTFQGDGAPIVASIAFSGLSFTFAYSLIRWLGPSFIRAGLKGRDMSKKGGAEM